MLIRGWDRGAEDEWRQWLAAGRDFGTLAANGPEGPVLVPTHFLLDAGAGEVLLHLAAANPLLAAVRADPRVTLAVTDDYAFAPGRWRGAPYVPTSYYASVQFSCTAELVEDPAGKAAILNRQLAHFQPEWPEDRVTAGAEPYGPMLTGLRGLRLTVRRVRAKFKYDDKKPVELQGEVAERLAERAAATGNPQDAGARAQLLRRMALRTAGAEQACGPARVGPQRGADSSSD
ncbi:FMN-binding negative transcriptional regulator [Streptomyces sp. TLI_171]|uniref:FMN-binding negative transcriptional regulator n=1 Tax=Streptomyces sp. TLI_171 TaxID=1938859 RepID=UPI000C189299|nr:FMN-binding negative transcriptional regulator [Streptomyces sp. TLI_171]RKE22857.1 PaiB family negative transcriptional regulator [Streptomyces sp. TLI_171]